jgi:transcriptional regulator with XRE-family HTH domain
VSSPNDAIFGKIIADLRKSVRLSQEELAERAGVHRTYVSQLERGLKSPTLDTVLKLSSALGTRPSTVMRKLEAELPLRVPN